MVTATCQMKLIDFDTAKSCMGKFISRPLLSFNRRTSVEFGDEQGMGTVAFMAPEILTKKGYGRAVDWYDTNLQRNYHRYLIINLKIPCHPIRLTGLL